MKSMKVKNKIPMKEQRVLEHSFFDMIVVLNMRKKAEILKRKYTYTFNHCSVGSVKLRGKSLRTFNDITSVLSN